jgi:addiction module HigA family antidote
MRLPSNRRPSHPGRILLEEFLIPMNISQTELAEAIKVSFQRINTIIKGKRDITINSALRLAKFFGNSAEFWLNAQLAYDLYNEIHSKEYKEIEDIRSICA